jgi:PAS domain S-box-containing protein
MEDGAGRDEASGSLLPEGGEYRVLESAAIGMAIADINCRFLTANAAYLRLTGYTAAELLEFTLPDIIEEADRPAALDLLNQLATGVIRQSQFESRHRRKDRSLVRVRLTVSLMPSGPGSPERVFVIAEDVTERRRAIDELTARNEILQKVFDHIPVMINFVGADGKIQLVNREWERALGWTLEELQRRGIDIFDECYPEPRARREVMDFLAAAKGEWADFRPRVRDGRTIDTMWTSVKLSDGTAIGIGADITERKRTEQALRETEQTLRQLAENVNEVFWVIDPKARRPLYVSPSYERVFGRTCESLYRDMRSFMDGIHPEDRQRVAKAFLSQIGGQIPLDITYRVIRPDSSTRWIRDRSSPVRDADGEVQRFVGIAEDITEGRRAEEKLRRSEAYLAESERLSHIGSWAVLIPSREITFWSLEHYRIFGFDPAEGPPSLSAALARIHPEDRGAAVEVIDRALGEAKDFKLDFRVVLPDGSIGHVHSLGRPVLSDAGDLVEFTGMAMDVTERKLAEEALQRSVEQLRALAEKSQNVREEERTRLAREIHDELGQALTGIKLDLRSVIDRPLPRQAQARTIQAILHSVDETIQSVRKIATDLRPGVLDDLGLVAAVEWAAQDFAARANARCTMSLPPENMAMAPAVATALFRILQEALTNIARHAEATEFSVRLDEEGDIVCLEIRDNGRGFQEAQLAPVRTLGVLGMKERALLLGGALTISSSPGNGTTVTARIHRRGNGG